MPAKAFAFSDTEKRTIGKTDEVKTSAARQAWKHAIDSQGKLSAGCLPYSVRTFCELGTKMAIGFLSSWIFLGSNGAR
ncbi:MAG: hypothetical protein DME50_07975 [Verrucomicrobia bacterium]|nr:MAG: hypothetical protein DME50_07975 [Verrucomicrobiota bacterium]